MRSTKAEEILSRVRAAKTPYDIEISGIKIQVNKDVYPTSELSDLVVECLKKPEIGLRSGECVLDYGTGTGFLAIAAARLGAGKVVALDINESAVGSALYQG